jgi:hypothetical protein
MDAWTAAGPIGPGEVAAHMSQEDQALPLASAGCSGPPGIISADAHTEHAAQTRHRCHRLLRIDEPEPYRLVSLAKKAIAFSSRSSS